LRLVGTDPTLVDADPIDVLEPDEDLAVGAEDRSASGLATLKGETFGGGELGFDERG
jgi:hypothetical protein